MAVSVALAGTAKLRGGKAVHPDGVTYSARLLVDGADLAPDSELLRTPREWPAIVRFSRSVGLPRPLPDLLGMSIRVPDAYGDGKDQDLLFISSADLPILHHLFLPARDVQERPFSSSLPFRSGSRTFLLGARSHAGSPRPQRGDEFHRLAEAAATGQLRFELTLASLMGRFERIGELQIAARLPADANALRFNPFNTGSDLRPIGPFNSWRNYAYPLSQQAWGNTGDRAKTQQLAERITRDATLRPERDFRGG
jgi:hypothetical protein